MRADNKAGKLIIEATSRKLKGETLHFLSKSE